MNIVKKTITAIMLAASIAASSLAGILMTDIPVYAKAKDLYFDADGNLCFESTETKRTSAIGYETVGYTFHKANTDGSIDETSQWASLTFSGQKAQTVNGNQVTTIYYMDSARVQESFNYVDPTGQWYSDFVNGNGTIYASAIMRTFVVSNGQKRVSGEAKFGDGHVSYTGNVYDFRTVEALATAYNWAGNGADQIRYEHFRKKLTIKTPKVTEQIDDNAAASDSQAATGDYASWNMSGRTIPYVLTYHTDATYDVGEGIPGGNSLTNGIIADNWYGAYAYSPKEVSDDFELSYNVKYTYCHTELKWTNTGKGDDGWEYLPQTIKEERTRTVTVDTSRSSRYYAIRYLQLYQLTNAIISNDSYGKASYGINYSLDWDALINGQVPTGADEYTPDDLAHIDYDDVGDPGLYAGEFWDTEPSDQDLINAAGVQDDADNKRIYVYVKNDKLTVDGNEYMSDDTVSDCTTEVVAAPEPDEIKCATAAQVVSRDKISDGDFSLVEQETTQTVPRSKDNGKYDTTLTANYTNVFSNSTESTTRQGTDAILKDTRGYERGTDVFEENEPVVVHTPVISPVSIYEGKNTGSGNRNDTTTKATGNTQLVNTPPDEVDGMTLYKMRLDKTYTIKFDPYTWLSEEVRSGNMSESQQTDIFGHTGFDIAGYGYSNDPSKYDDYVQLKQVRFPFDVAWIDQSSGEEHYVFVNNETGYTDWVDIQSNDNYTISFYIPSWAKESTTKFGADVSSQYYKIQFRVEACNTGSNKDATEDTMNSKLKSYVATYDVAVNLSGWLYGFQIIGTSDKDMFAGYEEGASESTDYPFCLTKEEKKSGTKNRVGGSTVRYTVDGTTTNNWNVKNTTPLSTGSSTVYSQMGSVWKGTTFSYSFKSIANLGDNNDTISIKPQLRYYDSDLNLHSDIAIYYTDSSGKFIEYGADRDTSNVKTVSLSSDQFKGSWYQGSKFLADAGISQNALGYDLPDDLTYTADNLGITVEKFLNQKNKSYCLSSIVLNKNMRILSGHEEELERNLSTTRNQNDFSHLNAKFSKNGSVVSTADSDTFKTSMQTWYGQYTVPNKLFVCDKADIEKVGDVDGDGDVDLDDYALKYPLSEESDLWFKDGYLVINFDITSKNGGVDHLKYEGGTDDMWKDENSRTEVEVPKDGTNKGGTIKLRSGDIALVDLRYSVSDKYSAHIFMIN